MISRAQRIGSDDGFAIPVAIYVLMIFFALSLATAFVATTALSQATRDGQVKRALAASDAGMEVAHYRMNKLLLMPDELVGLLNLDPSIAEPLERAQLACLSRDTEEARVEIVPCSEAPVATDVLGDGTEFRYWIETSVQILPATADLPIRIERRVLSEGKSGPVRRRAVETYWLELEADGSEPKVDAAWRQAQRWHECPGPTFDSTPDFDC